MVLKIKNSKARCSVVLIMVLTLLFVSAAIMPAGAAEPAKLKTDTCIADRKTTVKVNVSLENNPGIWGLKFKVDYDHSAFKLLSADCGTVFTKTDITEPENLEKESYVFLGCAGAIEDIKTDGTVITLTFQVAKDAEVKDYPVSVTVSQAVNAAGNEVDIAAQNGKITVTKSSDGKEEVTTVPESGSEMKEQTTQEQTTAAETVTKQETTKSAEVAAVTTSVTKKADNSLTTGDTAAVTMLFIMLCISGCVAFCMVRKKRNQKIKEV